MTTISKGAICGGSQKPFSSLSCSTDGGQDALDSNAIAAHDRGDFLAILVQHPRPHRLRVLVAQLEDVADLDRGVDAQRAATIGTVFSRSHAAQISVSGRLEVAARRDVLQVIVLFIGPADQIGAAFERFVHQQHGTLNVLHVLCPGDADGSQKSRRRIKQLPDFLFRSWDESACRPAQTTA